MIRRRRRRRWLARIATTLLVGLVVGGAGLVVERSLAVQSSQGYCDK